MSDNIILSVTVLSYNNEQYVEDCLKSIERQGIETYEVFVVDDRSTDNSVEVIRNFIKDKPQFTLIQKEQNSGGAVSSQIGLARSRGKYCAIVDSDDIVADGAYKRLIERIEKDGSDFSAGYPLRFISGYLFTYLTNTFENSIFAFDRVLETSEEKAAFCHQGYYWNCIFKKEFLDKYDIGMPSGLLYADRIILYKAVYYAKKISIDKNIVYYWRQKNNPEKRSITDRIREYQGVADRCDSFDSQLRITLENSNGDNVMNTGLWSNSLSRLYYPLMQLLELKNVDKDYICLLCDRYRLMLTEYAAFFTQLVDGGYLNNKTAYLTINLLKKRYDNILALAKPKDPNGPDLEGLKEDLEEKVTIDDLPTSLKDADISKSGLKEVMDFSITRIGSEGGKLYAYCQISNRNNMYHFLQVSHILAVSRYYRQNSFELPYDRINNRFEITNLPETTYNFTAVCRMGSSNLTFECRRILKYPLRIHFETEDKIITSSKFGGNPFTIMRKNKYSFLKNKKDIYLYINQKENKAESVFFYNILTNRKTELEEVQNSLFRIDIKSLESGNNMLLVQNSKNIYSTVSLLQFCNSPLQKKMFKDLFISNRVEIIK